MGYKTDQYIVFQKHLLTAWYWHSDVQYYIQKRVHAPAKVP